MSIASEIQRLQQAKADIKTVLENKGIAVPSSLRIDEYAQLIIDNLIKDKRLTQYLTFKVIIGGDIKWSGSTVDNSLQYSKDNGSTWTTVNSADTISVSPLDKVMWKGTPAPTSDGGIGTFGGDSAVRFDVEGNVMSLLFGDNFIGQKSLSGKDYAFFRLFRNCTGITSAINLSLPATTLAESCYRSMFQGCSGLTTAPALPATTLVQSCYENMFENCTGLTTAPELPATTLANKCYNTMFRGCTSLNYIKCLATDISATDCITNWVSGVSSTGTFIKNASMSSWTTGVNGIPTGWIVQTA